MDEQIPDECNVWSDRLRKKHKAFISLKKKHELPPEIQRRMDQYGFHVINSYKRALSIPLTLTDTNKCQESADCIGWEKELVDLHNMFVKLKRRVKGWQERWRCGIGNKMNDGTCVIIDSYDFALSGMMKRAKEFLHHLDDTKHSEEMVKLVIDTFPQARTTEFHGYLPIQTAVANSRSVKFVPILAHEENSMMNIHNAGLDLPVPTYLHSIGIGHCPLRSYNVRQWLVISTAQCKEDQAQYDSKYLDTIKRLEANNLFTKEQFRSIRKSIETVRDNNGCQARIRYLLNVSREEKEDSPTKSDVDVALSIDNRVPGTRKKSKMHTQVAKSVTPCSSSRKSSWKKPRVSLPRSVLNSGTNYERHLSFEFGSEAKVNTLKKYMKPKVKK